MDIQSQPMPSSVHVKPAVFFIFVGAMDLLAMSLFYSMATERTVLTITETEIRDNRFLSRWVGKSQIAWKDVSKLEYGSKYVRNFGLMVWIVIYDLRGKRWRDIIVSQLSAKPRYIFDAACYAHSKSDNK